MLSELPILGDKVIPQETSDHAHPLVSETIPQNTFANHHSSPRNRKQDTRRALTSEPFEPMLKVLEQDDLRSPSQRLDRLDSIGSYGSRACSSTSMAKS